MHLRNASGFAPSTGNDHCDGNDRTNNDDTGSDSARQWANIVDLSVKGLCHHTPVDRGGSGRCCCRGCCGCYSRDSCSWHRTTGTRRTIAVVVGGEVVARYSASKPPVGTTRTINELSSTHTEHACATRHSTITYPEHGMSKQESEQGASSIQS